MVNTQSLARVYRKPDKLHLESKTFCEYLYSNIILRNNKRYNSDPKTPTRIHVLIMKLFV